MPHKQACYARDQLARLPHSLACNLLTHGQSRNTGLSLTLGAMLFEVLLFNTFLPPLYSFVPSGENMTCVTPPCCPWSKNISWPSDSEYTPTKKEKMYLSKRLSCTVELYETIPFYSLLISYSQMQICLGFGKVSPRPFVDNERGFKVQKFWSYNELIAATTCHNYQLSYDDFSKLFYINNCVWQMQRIWTNLSG